MKQLIRINLEYDVAYWSARNDRNERLPLLKAIMHYVDGSVDTFVGQDAMRELSKHKNWRTSKRNDYRWLKMNGKGRIQALTYRPLTFQDINR